MDNKQKFETFLESLKGTGQDTLIESVKKGFQVCFENTIKMYDSDDVDPLMNELKNEKYKDLDIEAVKNLINTKLPNISIHDHMYEQETQLSSEPIRFNKGFVVCSVVDNSFSEIEETLKYINIIPESTYEEVMEDFYQSERRRDRGGFGGSPDPEDTINVGGNRYSSGY